MLNALQNCIQTSAPFIDRSVLVTAAVMALSASPALAGCGLNFDKPRHPFENMNQKGELSYWTDSLLRFKLGSGLEIPIRANFSPDERGADTFGAGWVVPFIDARVVPLDERRYKALMPDGYTRTFTRSKEDPTMLRAPGDWIAKISHGTIRVWAECGWNMTYQGGRLTTLTSPAGEKIDYVYLDGRIDRVISKNGPTLKVLYGPSGRARELQIGADSVTWDWGTRAVTEFAGGLSLVSSISPAVSEIVGPNQKYSFEYDSSNPARPCLKASGTQESSLTWNTETNFLIGDGPYSYVLKADERGKSPLIQKYQGDQLVGEHQRNVREGFVSRVDEGIKRTYRWFTSGKLEGKPRERSVEEGGKISKTKWIYDDQGRVRRIQSPMSELILNENEELEECTSKLFGHMKFTYTESGQLESITFPEEKPDTQTGDGK